MTDTTTDCPTLPQLNRPAPDFSAPTTHGPRKLADYKRLAGYVVWEHEFPRTASQKLKREVLAREIRERLDRSRGLQEL